MFQRSFHGDRLVVRQQLHQELLFQLRSELLNQDDASVTTRKLLSIYKPPKTKDQSDEFKYPIRNKHSRLDMTWKLGTHLLMKSKQKDRLCKYLLKLSGLEPKLVRFYDFLLMV
ncbi:hypothetical protein HDV02_000919 [Globomyces sp. JEL0801]|nr:hypothetical protein HDV02_000919 [Globomyces sp. JEL0801]